MTQQELREFVLKLTKTLVAKKCYIKGYGDKFRVIDENHNPELNIDKRTHKVLEFNNIIQRDNLIWRVIVTASPFAHAIDVKLPIYN